MLSIKVIDDLSALGRYRWAVPVLALLAERDGARFVVMLNALGIARESLVRTLEATIQTGWVMRNPRHGHPLRPEYLLTPEGYRIAQTCRAVISAQAKLGLPPSALTRWCLPVIRLISEGQNRFNMIERALVAANPRSLTQSLKGMVGVELIDRAVIAGYPPVTNYGLTSRGGVIADALLAL